MRHPWSCQVPDTGPIEESKTRPSEMISPDEMNQAPRTVIIAPRTTQGHAYPWPVPLPFGGKTGRITLDQIWAVDRERLIDRLGTLDHDTVQRVTDVLAEMIAP